MSQSQTNVSSASVKCGKRAGKMRQAISCLNCSLNVSFVKLCVAIYSMIALGSHLQPKKQTAQLNHLKRNQTSVSLT